MQSYLIHPQLMQHLAQTHFKSRVTVNSQTTTYDAANEPVFTYTPIAQLSNIPAYIEPAIGPTEIRRKDQTVVVNGYNILLAGYFPTISEEDTLIDQDKRTFNIIDAATDDTRSTTWIVAERVDPPINDNG